MDKNDFLVIRKLILAIAIVAMLCSTIWCIQFFMKRYKEARTITKEEIENVEMIVSII